MKCLPFNNKDNKGDMNLKKNISHSDTQKTSKEFG